MVVMWSGQDMKQQKDRVGWEYVMAYCVLHFSPGVRKIISELVCDDCNKTSAFVDVCQGGCRC